MSGGENKTIFTHEKLIKSLNYKLMKYVTKIKCKWKDYSTIPVLCIYPRETLVYVHAYSQMFTAALFIMVKK